MAMNINRSDDYYYLLPRTVDKHTRNAPLYFPVKCINAHMLLASTKLAKVNQKKSKQQFSLSFHFWVAVAWVKNVEADSGTKKRNFQQFTREVLRDHNIRPSQSLCKKTISRGARPIPVA